MSSHLGNLITGIRSQLSPAGSIQVLCQAQGTLVQLSPAAPGAHMSCSVEQACRKSLQQGCAKLANKTPA